MKVPLSLLLNYCDPGLSAEEIASALALTGTEVERIRRVGVASADNFVVGKVVSAQQHPDADRLRVCSVDVGADAPAQIVCGAPNVAAGQTVAVALPGAVMPNGMKIKQAKLRGVESNGMICAEDELDLGTGHEGVLVLPEGFAPIGAALGDHLPIVETVLDLEITPNRPDCLGIYGVARELHAATGAALASAPWELDLGTAGPVDSVKITVTDAGLCPAFTARVYEGVTTAETPPAIRANLHAAGMRSISAVVDITNYVMLMTGEPMHAFDLDLIEGSELVVTRADAGEPITTLDGVERKLAAGDPVIRDSAGGTSIAGVMGGARSEVSSSTTRILLEAAVWDGPTINSTSTRLGLRSEASGRFEKGIAAIQALRAQAYASQLFDLFLGIRPSAGTVVVGEIPNSNPGINLPDGFARGLIGSDVDAGRITTALTALGFEVSASEAGLLVAPPAERLDVVRDVDVVEEIARIDGLERIPARLPQAPGAGGLSTRQRLRRSLVDGFGAEGLFEIAGWSFSRPWVADALRLDSADPRRSSIAIRNPMSEEESLLRTTLLGSILDSASRNVARGNRNVRLFEVGSIYLPASGGLSSEPLRASGVLIGQQQPASWRSSEVASVDVHSGIGVIESTLASIGLTIDASKLDPSEPFLHPGKSASITSSGQNIGWVGELHPLVAELWELPSVPVVVFELDVETVIEIAPRVTHYTPFSSQPAVFQDVAFSVDRSVAAGDLVRAAKAAGGAELERVEVFDVYAGEQVGEGRVSIGLRFSFRTADRTMTEEEATAIRTAIVEAVSGQTGAQARV